MWIELGDNYQSKIDPASEDDDDLGIANISVENLENMMKALSFFCNIFNYCTFIYQ